MHNFSVIFLVVLTFTLDIVLVGFLEISSHIPSMIFKVMEEYKVEHLSNILVDESEHITKKGRMCIMKVSFSEARAGFMDPRCSETPVHNITMWYKMPFIPPKFTTTCNMVKHTPIYPTCYRQSMVDYLGLCSERMSMKGSKGMISRKAPLGGQFSLQQPCDNNSGSSYNGSRTAAGKDTRSGKHDYEYNPQHGYCYSPSLLPFPGALQYYHQSPLNMTHESLQPTTSVSQQFPSHGPKWPGYDHCQGGYGESQMSPQQQFPGQGPSSPGALKVPPEPLGNSAVNRPISSSSTPPPGPISDIPGRPPISLQTKWFLPPVETKNIDVPRIVNLPTLLEISYDNYDADDESNNSLDFGGAEGKPPLSWKHTEFCLKQLAKWMEQANYSAFNKWKKVWVAGIFEKKHMSIIQENTHSKQLGDWPLHPDTAVSDLLVTFEDWLPLDDFDNAE